jgi:hypothetical protein
VVEGLAVDHERRRGHVAEVHGRRRYRAPSAANRGGGQRVPAVGLEPTLTTP